MNAAHEAARRLGANLPVVYIEIGVPLALAQLACEIDKHESVLDGLDEALARKADLNSVWPQWALWLFEVELLQYKTSAPAAALFRRELAGDPPSEQEWQSAASLAVKVSARALAGARAAWSDFLQGIVGERESARALEAEAAAAAAASVVAPRKEMKESTMAEVATRAVKLVSLLTTRLTEVQERRAVSEIKPSEIAEAAAWQRMAEHLKHLLQEAKP